MADDPAKHGGEDLDRRIVEAQAKQARGSASAGERSENTGWAMGIDFVGAVLVSTFIGWAIDRWAGTAPWGLIVFLVLGFCAGVRAAMKASAQGDQGDGSAPGDDRPG